MAWSGMQFVLDIILLSIAGEVAPKESRPGYRVSLQDACNVSLETSRLSEGPYWRASKAPTSVLRNIFCKVQRSASRKLAQNQALRKSVLNPRSREVWRQSGREREFRVSADAAQCGAFGAKACGYCGFVPP